MTPEDLELAVVSQQRLRLDVLLVALRRESDDAGKAFALAARMMSFIDDVDEAEKVDIEVNEPDEPETLSGQCNDNGIPLPEAASPDPEPPTPAVAARLRTRSPARAKQFLEWLNLCADDEVVLPRKWQNAVKAAGIPRGSQDAIRTGIKKLGAQFLDGNDGRKPGWAVRLPDGRTVFSEDLKPELELPPPPVDEPEPELPPAEEPPERVPDPLTPGGLIKPRSERKTHSIAASPGRDHKPSIHEGDPVPAPETLERKTRSCLKCGDSFDSEHAGERFCGTCRATVKRDGSGFDEAFSTGRKK